MGDESVERGVARRFGFGSPRSPISMEPSSTAGATLVRQLGIRPGRRVAMIGVTDPATVVPRNGRPAHGSAAAPREPVDVIIYQVESSFDLRRISELSKFVAPGGALWVLFPSTGRSLAPSHIERSCAAAGMTRTLTSGVSGELSGMKFIHRFADGR